MKQILVADENKNFRNALCAVLRSAGYQVIVAETGRQTLQILTAQNSVIDLFIMNLYWPDVDGFEILKVIKRLKQKYVFPILVMAGTRSALDDLRKIKALGASGFISKSSKLEEFVYRVNQCLNPIHEDLRATPRHPISILVEYKVNQKYSTAYTFNLAIGGLFLRVLDPPAIHTKIFMRFTLPNSKELISVDGEVAWKNDFKFSAARLHPPGIGIKFLNLKPKDEQKIKKFLEELKKSTSWNMP